MQFSYRDNLCGFWESSESYSALAGASGKVQGQVSFTCELQIQGGYS